MMRPSFPHGSDMLKRSLFIIMPLMVLLCGCAPTGNSETASTLSDSPTSLSSASSKKDTSSGSSTKISDSNEEKDSSSFQQGEDSEDFGEFLS